MSTEIDYGEGHPSCPHCGEEMIRIVLPRPQNESRRKPMKTEYRCKNMCDYKEGN
jgi:predicted RNA-binding Zn-ribbon protein involved in translation (DUF1610 family)